jgi:peroxiredoxin
VRCARAVIVIGAMLLLSGSVAIAAVPPRPGSQAPAFNLPIAVNGNGTLSLASLRGKGVYLNFFATWCGPCKVEAPYIGKLSKEFVKRNVVVVGVDELETTGQVKKFADQYRLPYRIVLDDSGDMGGSYGVAGLPLHVFIAPNGTVTVHRVGEMSEKQIRSALTALSSNHS